MALPKEIKIDEKVYTLKDHPELLTLVEAGRKEEKKKLQGEITALRSKIGSGESSEIEELKKQLTEKTKQVAAVNEELVKIKESKAADDKKSEVLDAKKKAKEKTPDWSEAFSKFKEEMLGHLKGVSEKVTATGAKATKIAVSSHRKELLEKYKGLIIPELLKGATIEELDSSIADVLKTSANYITAADSKGIKKTLAELQAEEAEQKVIDEKSKTPFVVKIDGVESTVNVPQPPDKGGEQTKEFKNPLDMTSEEFAKNKEVMERELMKQFEDSKK